jgi:hypothetical protein
MLMKINFLGFLDITSHCLLVSENIRFERRTACVLKRAAIEMLY